MKVLLFFMVIAIVSCTKFGKNVTVKGRVMNPVTGEDVTIIFSSVENTIHYE